jgi:hypothetical protein
MDPADYLAAEGRAGLLRVLDGSSLLVDHVIEHRLAVRGEQLRWVEGRVAALREVAPLVTDLPTEEVAPRIASLATRLDLDHRTVLDEVVAAVPRRETTGLLSGRSAQSPRVEAPDVGAPAASRRRRDIEAAARRASPRRGRATPPECGRDRTIGR